MAPTARARPIGRRIRRAAARFHRLRVCHRRSRRWTGSASSMKADRSADSTATCRRSATRSRRTISRWRSATCGRSARTRLATRRSESAARVLHREGVSRERGGLGDDVHHARRPLRRQRPDLRAPLRGAEPDRTGGATDLPAGRDGPVEPGPRRRGARVQARSCTRSLRTGRIAAAGMEVVLPTGKEQLGLGNGYTVFEPFAMWGQMLPRNSFVQMHGGVELPSDSTKAPREAVSAHRRRDHARTGPRLRPRVVAAGRAAVGAPASTVRRSGTSCRSCRCTLSKLQHVMRRRRRPDSAHSA